MSRKDFILIASVIADMPDRFPVEAIAHQFANALASTNSQFKRDLFIQAATGVVPVTARKARA